MSGGPIEVEFVDTDAVEVKIDGGATLTCYRANMGPGHGWSPVWITTASGERVKPPECFSLSNETLAAIREAEER